jgi:hypothetical protein
MVAKRRMQTYCIRVFVSISTYMVKRQEEFAVYAEYAVDAAAVASTGSAIDRVVDAAAGELMPRRGIGRRRGLPCPLVGAPYRRAPPCPLVKPSDRRKEGRKCRGIRSLLDGVQGVVGEGVAAARSQCQGFRIRFGKKFGPNRFGRISEKFR